MTPVRGALAATTQRQARKIWRFWTFLAIPERFPRNQKNWKWPRKTWSRAKAPWKIGGGDVWHDIPMTTPPGLRHFLAQRAGVGYGEMAESKSPGKTLLPVHHRREADTGEYVWHYQTGTECSQRKQSIMMADLPINGEKHHVVLTAPKNGFLYILDAKPANFFPPSRCETTWLLPTILQTAKPVLIPASQGGRQTVDGPQLVPIELQFPHRLVTSTTDRHPDTKAASKQAKG